MVASISSLTSLPPELRQKILSYVLRSFVYNYKVTLTTQLPIILSGFQINRLLRADAIEVLRQLPHAFLRVSSGTPTLISHDFANIVLELDMSGADEFRSGNRIESYLDRLHLSLKRRIKNLHLKVGWDGEELERDVDWLSDTPALEYVTVGKKSIQWEWCEAEGEGEGKWKVGDYGRIFAVERGSDGGRFVPGFRW